METRVYNGYTYQRSGPGEPWALVGPAQASQPATVITKRADPYAARDQARKDEDQQFERQRIAAEQERLRLSQESEARAQRGESVDQVKLNADLLAKGLRMGSDGQIERITDWQDPSKGGERNDRLSRLRQVAQQADRVQELFDASIGQTSGLAGILDYLPSDANARFDTAGAQLSQQGLAAFRVPGTGTVSDRDAIMFDRANLPTAATRDVAIEEQLRGIRARVDEEMKALGEAPYEWRGQVQPQQRDKAIPAANMAAPRSSIQGGMTATPTPGGSFGDAAGVMIARKLSDAYRGGADVSALNTLLRDNGFQEITDPDTIRTIQEKRPLNFAPPAVADPRQSSAISDLANGSTGAYALNALNAVSAGYLDELAGGQTQLAKEYANQQYPVASTLGTMTGATAAMLPAGRLVQAAAGASPVAAALLGTGGRGALTADALYGAAMGSGENNDSRGTGALTGGALAAGGGLVGSQVARALGASVRGVADPAVRYLTERNIPLTFGQTLGNQGMVGRLANKMESLPLVGDLLNERRRQGVAAFNREAITDALEPIGATVQGEAGQAAIGQAQDAVSQAYRNALSGVNVRADQPFVSEIAQALARGRAVPVQGDQFGHLMDTRFAPLFGQGASLTGDTAQAAFQTVRDARSQFANEGAMGSLVADELSAIDDALTSLMARQAPQAAEGLAAANAAYRNLQPINQAGTTAVNSGIGSGVFTPAQLNRAVASNTRNYGGRAAAARGDQQTDLMTYGQEVLPATIPNSGTGDRIAAMLLPAALGGGAYGVSDMSPTTAAILAGLAGASSGPGSRALQAALVRRPDAARQIGERIIENARIGGMLTVPLALEAGQ